MLHASTSPFYPLFAALDVNAKIHEGRVGVGCGRSALRWGLKPGRRFLRAVSCSARLSRPLLMANCGRIIRRQC
ncbi:hypothetical protein ACVV4G_14975 [Escherichia coli]